MILPALREIWRRHGGEIELQILGVFGRSRTLQVLKDTPVRIVRPMPEDVEYTRFMPWFTRTIRWDIALSPLQDTPFNRCKSDIKFLDYSAIGAAGIYSRGPAYASTGWQTTVPIRGLKRWKHCSPTTGCGPG
jgi:hypothetical protein